MCDFIERICSCCKVSKPFTNEYYYIGGNHSAKCRACKNIKIGDKPKNDFIENLNQEIWKKCIDFDDFYFERDSSRIFNTSTGKYSNNIRSFRNTTGKDAKDIKWKAYNGIIPENYIVKLKNEKEGIMLDNL